MQIGLFLPAKTVLNDGTEYTHSEMKADGTVLVYVETPDAEDGFHSLLCVLPKYEIKDVYRGKSKIVRRYGKGSQKCRNRRRQCTWQTDSDTVM